MTAASTPREVIAAAANGHERWSRYDEMWACSCGAENPYRNEDGPSWAQHVGDAILSALTEAGWTVARLEFDHIQRPANTNGEADVALYRKLLPQEEAP